MWLLLHFNRVMQVFKRAANRPVGDVDSAVMLNAKLEPGVTLLHETTMTRSLGALQTIKDEQLEIYRWSDNGQSYVDCTFQDGRLARWDMVRPAPTTPRRRIRVRRRCDTVPSLVHGDRVPAQMGMP